MCVCVHTCGMATHYLKRVKWIEKQKEREREREKNYIKKERKKIREPTKKKEEERWRHEGEYTTCIGGHRGEY